MSKTLAKILTPPAGPVPRVMKCGYCGSDLHGKDCWRKIERQEATTIEQRALFEKLNERHLIAMRLDRPMREDPASVDIAKLAGIKL